MPSRYYTSPRTDIEYPLTEAKYDFAFNIYKSDKKKAVPLSPGECLIACGLKRHRDIIDAFIGSGRDAYVIFKGQGDEPDHAVHFVLRASNRRIIDEFDTNRKALTAKIELTRPPYSWTLNRRRENNERRRKEIETNTGAPVKPRGRINKIRVSRLGVKHRPRAKTTRGGHVHFETKQEV